MSSSPILKDLSYRRRYTKYMLCCSVLWAVILRDVITHFILHNFWIYVIFEGSLISRKSIFNWENLFSISTPLIFVAIIFGILKIFYFTFSHNIIQITIFRGFVLFLVCGKFRYEKGIRKVDGICRGEPPYLISVLYPNALNLSIELRQVNSHSLCISIFPLNNGFFAKILEFQIRTQPLFRFEWKKK